GQEDQSANGPAGCNTPRLVPRASIPTSSPQNGGSLAQPAECLPGPPRSPQASVPRFRLRLSPRVLAIVRFESRLRPPAWCSVPVASSSNPFIKSNRDDQ